MITRQDDGAATVHATFHIHADGAERADLLGDFNDWTPQPMERRDGTFVTTVELSPGRTYRFRYLLDGERWENDWAADAYVPNEYGGDDSLIDLTNPVAPAPIPGAPDDWETQGTVTLDRDANASAVKRRSRRQPVPPMGTEQAEENGESDPPA